MPCDGNVTLVHRFQLTENTPPKLSTSTRFCVATRLLLQIRLLDFAGFLLQMSASEYWLCHLHPELGGGMRWLAKMLTQVFNFQKETVLWFNPAGN